MFEYTPTVIGLQMTMAMIINLTVVTMMQAERVQMGLLITEHIARIVSNTDIMWRIVQTLVTGIQVTMMIIGVNMEQNMMQTRCHNCNSLCFFITRTLHKRINESTHVHTAL